MARIFGSSERSTKVDPNMLKSLLGVLDDEGFAREVLSTHAPDEGDVVDAHSLFVLVDNTLKGTTRIVDGVVNPKVHRWSIIRYLLIISDCVDRIMIILTIIFVFVFFSGMLISFS